jgi:hypothetical protein
MDDVTIVEASMLVASNDALTTVRFVKVPESAVKVDAETWVAFNDAVPVTLMSPNVAVDALTALKVPVPFTVMELASMLIASIVAEETTRFVVLRFVNTPLVFSTLLEVNPLTLVARLVMSEMSWVCSEAAKLLVAAEMAASNPLISEAEWECPSSETALPFTVSEDALMFWKSTLESDIVTSPVTVNDWKVAVDAETVLA